MILIYSLCLLYRNPNPSNRPSFLEISTFLSVEDDVLLSWSNEDLEVSNAAHLLGSSLEEGKNLYLNLQNAYKKMSEELL